MFSRISKLIRKLPFNANQVMALFTIALAGISYCGLRDAQQAFIASTRAWIVPLGVRFDGEPKAGLNVRLKIAYENIGKEPAINVIHIANWTGKTFPVTVDALGMPYIDTPNTHWPPHFSCESFSNASKNTRAIYPGTKYEDIRYIFNGPPLPQTVVDGRESFLVYGCFVYSTFGKERSSPYCYYLQPKRGEPIVKWTFEACPGGTANPS